MIVKSYPVGDYNYTKLHYQIRNSNSVESFEGVAGGVEVFDVMGATLLDEPALDAVIAAHDPIYVPIEVTPRQARQALLLSGITEEMILTAMNSLPSLTKEMALIEWEYSVCFQRYNPLVTTMAQMLGWNSQQLDQLWILADTL